RACGRIDADALATLSIILERLMSAKPRLRRRLVAKARDIDSRLHDLIAGSCGNDFLAHELGRLKILFRAFRDVSWEHNDVNHDFDRLVEESQEHLEIIQALQAGKRREAARVMSRHIQSGVKYWSRALPDARANPAVPR